MLFNSINFLVFFSIVTSIYFIIPYKYRWMLLLSSSCYFYMAFLPIYILIIAFTIVIDYFAGILIENSQGRKRLILLLCSIVANVGILIAFKYYNFINDNITSLSTYYGYANPLTNLHILLPLGLTFHTFQGMSYNIEIYRGRQIAEKHFGIYSLYVMFYPQMVAGPIERPQNMLHQFYENHKFDYLRVTNGLKLMLWGFFIKVVIADNLAIIVNKVFAHSNEVGGLGIITAVIAFSIQIYCDFSGYSAIAIGAAQIMGITLMTNFRRPYFASSISEFWTRWHISLSTWFRDYIYIPLGGNKVRTAKWVVNIFIVFLISGLWHGANWTFVVWGALHGLFLVIGKISNPIKSTLSNTLRLYKFPKIKNLVSTSFTILLVAFTWIFFRAVNLDQALFLVKNIFRNWHLDDLRFALSALSRDRVPKLIFLTFVILLFAVEYYQEHYGSIKQLLINQNIVVRWTVYLFLVFSIIIFGAYDNLNFIYFNF